jgi:hypothetical protein
MKLVYRPDRPNHTASIGNGTTAATTSNQARSKPAVEPQQNTSTNEVSNADLRATVMNIVMCTLSIFEHLSVVGCVVYPYFGTSLLDGGFVCFGGSFGIGLKHSTNFFVFYFFNKKFSDTLHKILKF